MNLKRPAGQKKNKYLAKEVVGGLVIKCAQRGQVKTQTEPECL